MIHLQIVIVNEDSVSRQLHLFRYGWIHLQTVIVVNENESDWAQRAQQATGGTCH
jgi:hypothetical protein